jgi:hypothetical protein
MTMAQPAHEAAVAYLRLATLSGRDHVADVAGCPPPYDGGPVRRGSRTCLANRRLAFLMMTKQVDVPIDSLGADVVGLKSHVEYVWTNFCAQSLAMRHNDGTDSDGDALVLPV